MTTVRAIFQANPVRVLAILQAVVAVAVSFGLHLSAEQIGTIMALGAAVLGEVARSQVSPKERI